MKPNLPLALIIATSALFITASSLGATETDDRIETSARQSHVFKTCLKNDSIKTESKEGVVTLSGTVSESFHKTLAQDTVEGLPGVTRVDNQITVKGESPAEHSDTWIGVKVKTVLLFHRNVRATKTDVNVKDGVVILSGEASSAAQKDLTAEYARDVEGVKEVQNEMTIADSPTKPDQTTSDGIDDASITAQVKATVLAHHSTSALKTQVATLNGVVTVNGVADNAAEKSLVTRLVTDVEGVTDVINKMTVPTAVWENQTRPGQPQHLVIINNE